MNIDKYIGLPYQENGRDWNGVDCWGLARLYYKHELDIELPDYSELYTGSRDSSLSATILDQKQRWISVTEPVENDICVFNIYGEPIHIGVYVGNNSFLHSREGLDSVIESLSSIQWAKRLEGFYRYTDTAKNIAIVGAPHPLKIGTVYEQVLPGTRLSDIVDVLYHKYKISEALQARIVVAVDGVVLDRSTWNTTILKNGQQVSYKVIAQGRTATRLVLTVAVLVAAYFTYGATLELLPATLGEATVGLKIAAAAAAATVQVAGMALVDKIAPVRLPGMGEDPGQPNQLNLFNGSSNQASRFGAIPVILGKVRYTGLLGATPYTTTLTDTNILNLLIIWGFGPLQVDDICVGATNLEAAFYDADTSKGLPRPYTLIGEFAEDTTQTDLFNKRYPEDVEQVYSQQGELVNNAQEGTNVWREVTFLQTATGLDIVLTFPEGMRKIKTNGDGAGKVEETTATVEIQVAKVGDEFGATPRYQAGGTDSDPTTFNSVQAYSKALTGPSIAGSEYMASMQLYKWYIICLTPQNEIIEIPGYPTENKDLEPSSSLRTLFEDSSLASVVGITQTVKRLPDVPTDYVKLYSICLQGGVGVVDTINHLTALGGQGYTGFTLTTTPKMVGTPGYDEQATGDVLVQVSGGTYYPQAIPVGGVVTTDTHFATRVSALAQDGSGTAAVAKNDVYKGWSPFLKENGVWLPGDPTNVDLRGSFTLTDAADCYFEASVDDEAQIYIDGAKVFDLPKKSWSTSATGRLRLQAGTHQVRIVATNSEGGNCAVAFKVTSKKGSSDSPLKALGTIITFGTNDIYTKRKDPFNHVHSLRGLEEAVYKVRVRRLDNDDPENQTDYRKYHKVALLNCTSYGKRTPLQKLPRGNLARTVIQVQSSNKVNGNVDGVNALVQTQAYDWNNSLGKWEAFKSTNNPASLFLYILTHPANAFRVAKLESNTFLADVAQKVDLQKLQEWHNFCNTPNSATGRPKLTYNDVLTSTTSVMDAIRDVCAAGMASPVFIDGKWSVVIDKPRDYVVQHFTPHNSWGFESTKALPKIPDAFRVTIQDESDAYQTKEIIVYNYQKNETNAEVFEQLQLPGITNQAQAKFFAKWHLAQLKLRPETYTLNTDFEYLVCNRGDLVKVTHDVPMWGSGSGRLKAITGNTLKLSEAIYLETGKQYRVLVRNNTKNNTGGVGSIYKNLQAVTQTGYYDEVTCSTAITSGDNFEVDNLFIIGELNKETQDLIVLAVEPTSNLSARITLTDYSEQIYSLNLNTEFPNVSYNSNITATTGVVDSTIVGKPVINSVTSTRETSQQISIGIYQTTSLVSFSNPSGLTGNAKQVQFELVRADEQFSTSSPATAIFVRKETGNYTFVGLTTDIMYKLRARYTDQSGNIYGPWTDTVIFVAGASGVEPPQPEVLLDLETTYVVAKVSQNFVRQADFDVFEYRIYKDTGSEDFWELEPNSTNNIKIIRTTAEARFNLLDLPTPRISEAGITYRVACRAVNRNNEYSAQSALGTIVVKTIT